MSGLFLILSNVFHTSISEIFSIAALVLGKRLKRMHFFSRFHGSDYVDAIDLMSVVRECAYLSVEQQTLICSALILKPLLFAPTSFSIL